ncbi:DNA methyltransferase [Oceanobacillus sp. FSL W8-0428]|uniref:DNA methyltransferase n=1 Tax=Oceanobacillus sp. FSL W8-0428 TaxID=2921715 RepID=UPI0030FAA85E
MESVYRYISDFDCIKIDKYWNFADEKEDKVHQIHSYPAKFPAFITTKAIDYAENKKIHIETIGDIFCGCGTVAYESLKQGYNFLGYDINPVAALIARVKSNKLDSLILKDYYEKIIKLSNENLRSGIKEDFNSRIIYWFETKRIKELEAILLAINSVCNLENEYKDFFLCAFSNILKPTSRWLTKSIKPTIDSHKITKSAFYNFEKQFNKMYIANTESNIQEKGNADIRITDSLEIEGSNKVDLLVTSPPYVTSYEYADLHQLSLIWLRFGDDYREFRKGTIGSIYKKSIDKESNLNSIGNDIVEKLMKNGNSKSRIKAIKKYYSDMEKITDKTYKLLNENGMAIFVIGNTEYKNVKIRNAEHLALAMIESGFCEIEVTKRKISNKILTPYRDNQGKFSKDKNGRKIYSEEFIIVGRKL